jgi:hypothetical protein
MSNFYYNINGCIQYEDYTEAVNWLTKAKSSLILDDYSDLIVSLEKSWPALFKRSDFHKFKGNITSQDQKKTEIISALNIGDYEVAQKTYSKYFSYDEFPEFFELLNKYRKKNTIKSFNSKIKENLSASETELYRDMEAHLDHPDKSFYRKVQSTLADFYITKTSHYSLSIYNHKGRTVRHLPWSHVFARAVLSTELGDSITGDENSLNLGSVSLIGDYTPKGNDLTHVKYFTTTGRDYFSSALDALTAEGSQASYKIDVDNFMKMKEVIPTASQMKAIYAQDNYIIDGPAGTGKSTTLLQKLLILTQQNNLQSKDLLVLVKHDGLVEPFKKLLLDMHIKGVRIDSVDNFLLGQFDKQYKQVSLADIDSAEFDVQEVRDALDNLLTEESSDISAIDYLPTKLVNKGLVIPNLKAYYQTKSNIQSLEIEIKHKESEIRTPIDDKKNSDCLIKQAEERSFLSKMKHRKGFKLDPKDGSTLKKLEEKYKQLEKLMHSSPTSEHSLYNPILDSYEKEFILLENTIMGRNNLNREVSLGSYIEKQVQYEIDGIIDESKKEISSSISKAFEGDIKLQSLRKKCSKEIEDANEAKSKLIELVWGKALIVSTAYQKKLMHLLSNKSGDAKTFQTVIIDEAQDVPINHIEMVSFYSKQLVLAGDEAQKENPEGLGFWSNLRSKVGFINDDKLTIHKLRHNFRQTYELGSLSYNYRQLLLGQSIENIESDYFENQKGFNLPSIGNITQFRKLVEKKLRYIDEKFTQKFPLVVITGDKYEQKSIISELMSQNLTVSKAQDSNGVDVIVLTVDKVAGREFPVVISITTNKMADSTIYIILSRAKFDLTLIVPSKEHINNHLYELNALGMIDFN